MVSPATWCIRRDPFSSLLRRLHGRSRRRKSTSLAACEGSTQPAATSGDASRFRVAALRRACSLRPSPPAIFLRSARASSIRGSARPLHRRGPHRTAPRRGSLPCGAPPAVSALAVHARAFQSRLPPSCGLAARAAAYSGPRGRREQLHLLAARCWCGCAMRAVRAHACRLRLARSVAVHARRCGPAGLG